MNDNQEMEDRYFKGQQHNEHVICFFRQHWISLIAEICISVALLAVITFIFLVLQRNNVFESNQETGQLIFLVLFGGATFQIHRFFTKLVNYFSHFVIITDRRIVEITKTIYLKHGLDAIDLTQVQDLVKEQDGLMKNIINFGDISIILSATSSHKVLSIVPNPDFHFRVINRAIQAAKRGHTAENHLGGRVHSTLDEVQGEIKKQTETI